jgi:glycosyltransferase involved in cell wall biosynthesis
MAREYQPLKRLGVLALHNDDESFTKELAIISPSFHAISETFIRDHVKRLAPGRTILLCEDGHGAEQFGAPVLSNISSWRHPHSIPDRLANRVAFYRRTYCSPALAGADRWRVISYIQQYRPQAMLAEYATTAALIVDICCETRTPLYVHFHGFDASLPDREPRWRGRYLKLFDQASGVIAPSEFLAAKIVRLGCPSEKLAVCPCGIDCEKFSPKPKEAGRLLMVGRLVGKKAPHLAIEAFARIADRFQQFRLDVVGEGPLRERCESVIRDHKLEGRVILHGAQPSERVRELMETCSIFLQHSVTTENGDTEGLPVAILEAMASGLAVVSTRHAGIPEAIENGKEGILVAEHDVPGMAHALAELARSPSLVERLGSQARATVSSKYSINIAIARLRELLRLSVL